MRITVKVAIKAPVDRVGRAWISPEDIKLWNAASDDWHTTSASVDLRVGGSFCSKMEAKDRSAGFGFAGVFTRIESHQLIEYRLGDQRLVSVEFLESGPKVIVRESFDGASTLSIEQQRQGWQAILDNFARHVAQQVA